MSIEPASIFRIPSASSFDLSTALSKPPSNLSAIAISESPVSPKPGIIFAVFPTSLIIPVIKRTTLPTVKSTNSPKPSIKSAIKFFKSCPTPVFKTAFNKSSIIPVSAKAMSKTFVSSSLSISITNIIVPMAPAFPNALLRPLPSFAKPRTVAAAVATAAFLIDINTSLILACIFL